PQAGQAFAAQSSSRFVLPNGQTWDLDGRGGVRVTDTFGTVDTYQQVVPAKPAGDQLKELAGPYGSDEAEATLNVLCKRDTPTITRRPDTTLELTPVYADAFTAPRLGLVIFRRESGRVTGLSVVEDRVWDMRFTRRAAQPAPSTNGGSR